MIPRTAHFIWLGADLPWACSLAFRSALRFGGFEKAVLHHESELSQATIYQELLGIAGLELRVLDPQRMLEPICYGGRSLLEVYSELRLPAARANVLRTALLHQEGGVYLDTDTITVRDLSTLCRDAEAFVGEEHLALPFIVRNSKNPLVLVGAVLRRAVRDVFRRIPSGWRSFRAVERYYPSAANNAVLGCAAGHPLTRELTRAMVALEPSERTRRFALGTHLLQRVLAGAVRSDVRVLSPAHFYPLGPEISEHWFRFRKTVPPLEDVILPETLVVHWYASVRTEGLLPEIDRDSVSRNRRNQLFSALAWRVLDESRNAFFERDSG